MKIQKSYGEKAIRDSVSLPRELAEQARVRIESLEHVKTFSEYVQRLIKLDLRQGLLNREEPAQNSPTTNGESAGDKGTPQAEARKIVAAKSAKIRRERNQ